MSSQVQGLILVIFGVVCIAFSKTFGTRTSSVQRRLFGVDFTPRSLELGYVLGGIVFCIIGGLAIFGSVQFRP